MKSRSPDGAPDFETTVAGSPIRFSASSPGLAMVAEVKTNCGAEP